RSRASLAHEFPTSYESDSLTVDSRPPAGPSLSTGKRVRALSAEPQFGPEGDSMQPVSWSEFLPRGSASVAQVFESLGPIGHDSRDRRGCADAGDSGVWGLGDRARQPARMDPRGRNIRSGA